ncbi:glycine cleavage system protein GcvH [Candidatus Gracilibacteria bacterium]|nr:glycine cleavage system protein GcvH [Candidatus Gracilibacteria bacterium]
MSFTTPDNLRYSKSHEWVRVEGDEVVIGITDYAQDALGDVVYIELPQAGTSLTAGATFGVVESVKASSDLYAPVGGEIVAVNAALEADQSAINGEPYAGGWMLRIKADGSEDDLMDAAAYAAFVDSIAH